MRPRTGVGRAIALYRVARGYSMRRVAADAEMPRSRYWQCEAGLRRFRRGELERIVAILGVGSGDIELDRQVQRLAPPPSRQHTNDRG